MNSLWTQIIENLPFFGHIVYQLIGHDYKFITVWYSMFFVTIDI